VLDLCKGDPEGDGVAVFSDFPIFRNTGVDFQQLKSFSEDSAIRFYPKFEEDLGLFWGDPDEIG
jgi:hypothetical protein